MVGQSCCSALFSETQQLFPIPSQLKKLTIHTDGGCEGNPGPGGWGAVLRCGDTLKEISGAEPATTNNRMELQAAIGALALLKEPCEIELFTDSAYLKDGITKWLPSWKKRGWQTTEKKPVKNKDLWCELDRLVGQHQITWKWLKGHAGHVDNERCDQLARDAITEIRKQHLPAQLAALKAEFEVSRDPKPQQLALLP